MVVVPGQFEVERTDIGMVSGELLKNLLRLRERLGRALQVAPSAENVAAIAQCAAEGLAVVDVVGQCEHEPTAGRYRRCEQLLGLVRFVLAQWSTPSVLRTRA